MKRKLLIVTLVTLSVLALMWMRSGMRRQELTVPETIRVGTSADFQPFAYIENSEVVGFDIDVMNEIGRRLGKKVIITNMPFEVLLPQLQLGALDIIAAGMSPTPEREQRIAFSQPYLSQSPLVAITRKDGPVITSAQDLLHKEIIVNQGYTTDTYISNIPGMNVVRLGSIADALVALTHHKGDVFVTAASTAAPIITHHPDVYAIYELKDVAETMALGIAKDATTLLQEVNKALLAMEQDGTLEQLQQKWHIRP